jgi:hypothetical protein
MKRLITGFGVAAAFGLAATLSAQTTTTSSATSQRSSDHEVTITGCLERGPGGNYVLANARMDNDRDRSGAYPTTGATTTAGTTGTTSATGTTTGSAGTTAGAMNATGSTWTLEGDRDLDKHVGHRVQVTGKEVSSSKDEHATSTTTASTTGTTGSTAVTGEQRHSMSDHASRTLDVKSVKMISASCS